MRQHHLSFDMVRVEGQKKGIISAGKLAPSRDGNFIHGYGYPWVPYPHGQGMGTLLCPWVVPIPYPLSHG
jgi:hypothetical protein